MSRGFAFHSVKQPPAETPQPALLDFLRLCEETPYPFLLSSNIKGEDASQRIRARVYGEHVSFRSELFLMAYCVPPITLVVCNLHEILTNLNCGIPAFFPDSCPD